VVMPWGWSRCGGARITVQWAEGAWEEACKLVNAILLHPIIRARGKSWGEHGFMLARWRQSRRDAVLPVRSSRYRRTAC